MIPPAQIRKGKIDISPLKKISGSLPGTVSDLISGQNSEMDLNDFLSNVKVWENLLKKETEK